MDRFHEMQVFLAVAEEESFAAAARRLKTSPPSVTRAIAAMEQRIGTQTAGAHHSQPAPDRSRPALPGRLSTHPRRAE